MNQDRSNKPLDLPPCYVWLCQTKHVNGCLVKFYKNTIVYLSQAEELQYFTRLRMKSIDTKTTHKQALHLQVHTS